MDDELSGKYAQKKGDIESRLRDFKNVFRNYSEKELFAEMCFCLLTPQSKAKTCWRAIEKLKENGKLYDGSQQEVLAWLAGVRFNISKSSYVIEARNMFHNGSCLAVREKLENLPKDGKAARECLAVKGMSMKVDGNADFIFECLD